MSSLTVSLGVFVAIMVAALAGLLVRAALPADHTSEASKDVIKIGMGLVVTLSAMVLGLLVASAKSSYNTKVEEIDESAARVIMLGPEPARVRRRDQTDSRNAADDPGIERSR